MLRLAALLCLLASLPGCLAATPYPNTPTPHQIELTHTPVNTPPTPRVTEPTATALPLAPVATAQPSLTSEPGELAPLPPVISAENLSTITVTQVLQFSPWELVLALAWSPDGQRLAIAAGENVFIYQGDVLEKQRAIRAPVWNTSLAFDPSGAWLAGAGRDGHVRTWNTLTGEPGLDITAHAKGANHVAYNPNGSILASSGNDAVSRTWDSSSGAKLGEIIGGTFAVPSFVFTSDGEYLGLTNGSLVRFRHVTSERFAFTVYGSGWFHSLAISADGRWLATGEVNNQVQIWDLSGWQNGERQTEQSYASASGHQGVANNSSALVWQVNFHPSGELLVSAGGDKTARIWQAPGGSLLATLHGQRLAITSAAFSPDGRRLATGSLDGSVWIWEVAGQLISASGGSAAP